MRQHRERLIEYCPKTTHNLEFRVGAYKALTKEAFTDLEELEEGGKLI